MFVRRSADIATTAQQPLTSKTRPHSAAEYSNMRRIQRERRRRENLEGESRESHLRREMDCSERGRIERDPIIPPHDTLSSLQEENRKLQEENKNLERAFKQVDNALSQCKLALKTQRAEGEMLGREIGLEFAVERLKRINAVEAMHRLLDDKEKFEGWQGFYKFSASTVRRLQAEIATEKKEREDNPHSELKSQDYRVRIMKGKDGERYTVFDHDNPRSRRLRSEEDDEASEYADLVSDAEWIYEKMVKKREMDQGLEMERIREIQEEVLTLEQPEEDIEAQKLKEDERLGKLEETRGLKETEEEMEDDEDEIEIAFFPPSVENECQKS
ncbi:ddd125e9-dfb1-4111-997d-691e2485c0ed [Sclerotinia trifoliorum]|uniref:Ddd125e9-dfb1-4111-997d-691e2485c0ed n=1 Tax=Sclerotinia trifoliorum TaxID=28548 RepID=A0A8H2ZPI9_9HELO|nr:ddd125e9-dfb1-4111-997d-691e2485c0ed [Sclerotinia trifoliorum]